MKLQLTSLNFPPGFKRLRTLSMSLGAASPTTRPPAASPSPVATDIISKLFLELDMGPSNDQIIKPSAVATKMGAGMHRSLVSSYIFNDNCKICEDVPYLYRTNTTTRPSCCGSSAQDTSESTLRDDKTSDAEQNGLGKLRSNHYRESEATAPKYTPFQWST